MFEPGNRLAVGHGRPKGSSKPALIRKWAEEKGIEKLIELAEGKGHTWRQYNGRLVEVGPSHSTQMEALKLALAYGLGRPVETIDMRNNPLDPEESKLRVDQMLDLVKRACARPPVTKPATSGGNGVS